MSFWILQVKLKCIYLPLYFLQFFPAGVASEQNCLYCYIQTCIILIMYGFYFNFSLRHIIQ